MKKALILFCIITVLIVMISITIYVIHNNTNTTQNSNIEEREISFTRTYRIVKILDYEDATNQYTYIILDKFQEFKPYLIKLEKTLATTLTQDKFYEFTFNGIYKENIDYSNIQELFNNFNIISIKLTDKSGLEQIQE